MLPAKVIFPDVELLLTGLLREEFPEVEYIGRRVPRGGVDELSANDYGSLIIVRRQGGESYTSLLDRPLVGFNVYARSEKGASDLAREVRAAVHRFPDLKRVRTSGPAEATTDTNHERRYFTADFTLKGAA